MAISTLWTKNVANDNKAKHSFEDALKNSSHILERLRSLLEEKEEQLYNKSISWSSFKSDVWPYEQAYINGRLAEIKELKELTNLS